MKRFTFRRFERDYFSVVLIIFLLSLFTGCSRYRPTLMIKFTKAGEGLTLNRLIEGASPSWSPDARALAYEDEGIWIIDLATKKRKRITKTGTNPSWSPDGSRIAYVNNGIWLYNIASDSASRIIEHGQYPCWFNNGRSLAFDSGGIFVMDIDENAPKRLLESGIPLSFSPDDSLLLIERFYPESLSFAIEMFDLTNFEIRRVDEGTKGCFSPDGDYVIFSNNGIWLYSIYEKNPISIVLDGYDPQWSTKGDMIAFCSKGSIWVMDAPYKQYK